MAYQVPVHGAPNGMIGVAGGDPLRFLLRRAETISAPQSGGRAVPNGKGPLRG